MQPTPILLLNIRVPLYIFIGEEKDEVYEIAHPHHTLLRKGQKCVYIDLLLLPILVTVRVVWREWIYN